MNRSIRTFYPITTECTFFSSPRGIFSWVSYMSGHKPSLKEFEKTEIISSILSDHEGMKLEIRNKRNVGEIYIEIQ